MSQQEGVESGLVLLDVLGETLVQLHDLVLVLPALPVGPSSEVEDGVSVVRLVQSPVSDKAGFLLLLWNQLAVVSRVLKSGLHVGVSNVREGFLLFFGCVLIAFLLGLGVLVNEVFLGLGSVDSLDIVELILGNLLSLRSLFKKLWHWHNCKSVLLCLCKSKQSHKS